MLTRRTLTAAMLGTTALAACGTTVTLGAVATDASLAVTSLQKAVAGIETANPTLISAANQATIATVLTTAASLVSGISATTAASAGASVVQQIDSAINTVLDIAATLPLIPPPYDLAIGLVASLAPAIEGGLNALLGLTSAAAPLTAAPLAIEPAANAPEA